MKLDYMEYLDLCDALISGICSTRRFARTAVDEEERKSREEKEERYQELLKKLKHYAVDNLY